MDADCGSHRDSDLDLTTQHILGHQSNNLHTHLIGAFPEQEDSIREVQMRVGKQIHLLVLPLTEENNGSGESENM